MNLNALFWEILRGIEIIAGWWFLFYKLNTPPTKVRRIALLAWFFAGYLFWYLLPIDVWFDEGTALGGIMSANTANEILWVAILLSFALICGNLRTSVFSAVWYVGVEQTLDVMRYFINRAVNDGVYVRNYPQFNLQYLLILGWAYFYYFYRRKYVDQPPLSFQILTAFAPIGALLLLTKYSDTVGLMDIANSLKAGLFTDGILLGFFILAINLIMFYLYIRLFFAYEAQTFAMDVSNTPPVWTPEAGISDAFVTHYMLSRREREVLNTLLAGKTGEEIADILFISPKTVETHLRNIYQKTKTGNRFALFTMIKG
jgi:DNA-binding CsgD family transcriptional regulator